MSSLSGVRLAVSRLTGLAIVAAMVSACGGGGGSEGSVGTGAATGTNHAPTIAGQPSSTIVAGQPYTFTPNASDTDGDVLTFTITGQPSWASFSASTGVLSGTPTAANLGSAANIVISVSDGKGGSASLSSFAINVVQSASGTAQLSWVPPTTSTDSSQLTNLAGYNVYYGTSPTNLSLSVQVTDPGASTYTIDNLSPAQWYFEVAAYTSDGVEGAHSSQVSKTIS